MQAFKNWPFFVCFLLVLLRLHLRSIKGDVERNLATDGRNPKMRMYSQLWCILLSHMPSSNWHFSLTQPHTCNPISQEDGEEAFNAAGGNEGKGAGQGGKGLGSMDPTEMMNSSYQQGPGLPMGGLGAMDLGGEMSLGMGIGGMGQPDILEMGVPQASAPPPSLIPPSALEQPIHQGVELAPPQSFLPSWGAGTGAGVGGEGPAAMLVGENSLEGGAPSVPQQEGGQGVTAEPQQQPRPQEHQQQQLQQPQQPEQQQPQPQQPQQGVEVKRDVVMDGPGGETGLSKANENGTVAAPAAVEAAVAEPNASAAAAPDVSFATDALAAPGIVGGV